MDRTSQDETTRADVDPDTGGTGMPRLRGRSGLLLAPLAGIALAAGLLAGCGGTTAGDDPATADEEVTGQDDTGENDDTTDSDDDTDSDDSADTDADESDDADGTGSDESGDDGSDDGTVSDDSSGSGGDENLFAGSWGFGHDVKTLSAEELSDLLEQEASARGPAEMSLEVECGDGIDSEAGDLEAECIAYADEGVEHLWQVSAGPAGAGLEIEVTNAG